MFILNIRKFRVNICFFWVNVQLLPLIIIFVRFGVEKPMLSNESLNKAEKHEFATENSALSAFQKITNKQVVPNSSFVFSVANKYIS